MELKRRSIVKALSWRLIGVLITGSIVLILTGNAKFALQVGLIDTVVKLAIYYFHERAWNKISYGQVKPPEYEI